jgi:cysteine desulfurase
MLLKLDEAGIFVSTGSACSSFDLRPSHVLAAIGQDPDLMHGSVRFSLGRFTTQDELDYALEVFPNIVSELLSFSALTTVHPKTYAKK